MLKSVLQKFYGCHHELVDRYGVCICALRTDLFNMPWFSFPLMSTWTWPFMSNWAGISRKAEDTYPTGAPGPCFRFLVRYELLIYFCYFVCNILVILCSSLCMSVFHIRSLSLDYIPLISARFLVLLITLSSLSECTNLYVLVPQFCIPQKSYWAWFAGYDLNCYKLGAEKD